MDLTRRHERSDADDHSATVEPVVIVVARLLAGVLLLAHGLVHLLFLAPDVDAFSLRAGRLPDDVRRPFSLVLMAGTVVAFALLALGTWGVPGLAGQWPTLALVAAVVSAVLLVAFWDRQLVLGLGIDVALVTLALWQPVWLQQLVHDTA
jgi:hypothetical protein